MKVLVIVAELESIGDVTPLIVTVPADSVVTVPAAEEELDDLTMGAAASPTHRLLTRIRTLLGATCRLPYSHAGGTTETPGVRCFTSGWRKTQCSSCSDHCHSRTESAACSSAWMATQLLLTGAAAAQCNGITAASERCAAQASRWTGSGQTPVLSDLHSRLEGGLGWILCMHDAPVATGHDRETSGGPSGRSVDVGVHACTRTDEMCTRQYLNCPGSSRRQCRRHMVQTNDQHTVNRGQ